MGHPFRAHTFKVYSFTQEGRTFSVAEGFFNYGYTSFFYNYQVFFISPNQISEINLSKRSVCISYLSATPTHNLVLTLQKKFPCRKKIFEEESFFEPIQILLIEMTYDQNTKH